MTSGHKFENWARTYTSYPELYFEPENREEIISIISNAENLNKNVRLVGAGHSPSDICCSDHFLISLHKMNKILEIDKDKKTVRVEAGIMVSDLVEKLKEYKMALHILPSITHFSLAGMISTATHNSGLNYGVTSTYVLELELLQANGFIVKCSRQNDPDLFLATLAGLGCMGIILAVTLQCTELYTLEVHQWSIDFEPGLQQMDQLAARSEYSRIFYIPHVPKLIVHDVVKKSAENFQPKLDFTTRIKNFVNNELVGYHLLQFLMFLNIKSGHRLAKWINWFYYWFSYKSNCTFIDMYDQVFTVEIKVKQYASEWALPIDKIGSAIRDLKGLIEQKGRHYPAHFPFEIRFVKSDDLWLSPAYGRTTAYVNIIAFRPYGVEPGGHKEFFGKFAEIMGNHGGRPHLAKQHNWTEKEMRKNYPKFDAFKTTMLKVDGKRRFANNYTRRVIGD